MRTRKYINNPEILLEQGQKIVTESADNKFVHRVTIVNLVLSGMTPKYLAEYCPDSERTIQSWVKSVDEKGWDSLVSIKQTGRPNKLNDQQIETIKDVVSKDPLAEGYNVWDGPSLHDYIDKKFNVDYGVRACQKLLHKMGFSLVRPQPYPSLENPDEDKREEFKKN